VIVEVGTPFSLHFTRKKVMRTAYKVKIAGWSLMPVFGPAGAIGAAAFLRPKAEADRLRWLAF
jgi:hypothetical protein